MAPLTIIFFIKFGQPNEEGGVTVSGPIALLPVLIWFIYFPLAETLTGKTLGKKIMGTTVIMESGNDISFTAAFVRHVLDWVDLAFGGIVGVLIMINSKKRKRLGDIAANTIVIEDQTFICDNCKGELILTPLEIRTEKFICPMCKHENNLLPH